MILNSLEKKMLVQCAIAAVNHRLFEQAAVIEHILPLVVDNQDDLQTLLAVMEVGRGEFINAFQRLEENSSPETASLRSHLQELINDQ